MTIKKCKICDFCGAEFTANSPRQKFCKTGHQKKCRICGKQFICKYNPGSKVWESTISCSKNCKTILIKQTKKERYGIENYNNCDKAKQTNLERYGVENPMQSDDIKQKMKQTNLERYGVENPFQSEDIKEKIRQTNLERYGVEWSFLNYDVKEKIRQTNLERYGVENLFQSKQIQEKRETSFSDRRKLFGKKCTICNKIISWENRQRKTCGEKKCVDEAIRNTCLEKYGTTSFSRKHIKHYDEWLELDKWAISFREKNGRKPTYQDAATYFEVDKTSISLICCKNNLLRNFFSIKDSYWEIKIGELLSSNMIVYERRNRSILKPQELDLVLSECDIAIEVNDVWTHNSTSSPNDNPKSANYHYNKTKACQEKGVQLIHLWEWQIRNQWDIVSSMLLAKCGKFHKRYYARKLEVSPVPPKIAREWFARTHIQGPEASGQYMGLWDGMTLVACMARRNNELTRFSTELNTQVVGGYSRLEKALFKPGEHIITYSFNDYSDGGIYGKAGFTKVSEVQPRYWWVKNDCSNVLTRRSCQKKNISARWPEYYDYNDKSDSRTEKELMAGLGYLQVFDSGKVRWDK